jgi:hypothetical protein
MVDRPGGEIQPIRNPGIAEALSEQLQDFELARGELGGVRTRAQARSWRATILAAVRAPNRWNGSGLGAR